MNAIHVGWHHAVVGGCCMLSHHGAEEGHSNSCASSRVRCLLLLSACGSAVAWLSNHEATGHSNTCVGVLVGPTAIRVLLCVCWAVRRRATAANAGACHSMRACMCMWGRHSCNAAHKYPMLPSCWNSRFLCAWRRKYHNEEEEDAKGAVEPAPEPDLESGCVAPPRLPRSSYEYAAEAVRRGVYNCRVVQGCCDGQGRCRMR